MIREVLEYYYPQWSGPEDNGYHGWIKTECPVHDDDNPSASINYEREAFNCFGCGYSGDVYSIIKKEEGVGFAEAKRIAERIAESVGIQVPRSVSGESRRGVPSPPRFKGI